MPKSCCTAAASTARTEAKRAPFFAHASFACTPTQACIITHQGPTRPYHAEYFTLFESLGFSLIPFWARAIFSAFRFGLVPALRRCRRFRRRATMVGLGLRSPAM